MANHEFLPLCDVLFNIISLASYFCDIVFDLVMGYALLERGRTAWFVVTLMFVALSLAVSQVVSLRWYLHTVAARSDDASAAADTAAVAVGQAATGGGDSVSSGAAAAAPPGGRAGRAGVVALHLCQLGVLWRYFKLFLPVDLRFVKYEVRDLCMLRLVHAFVQAAPMLLVQLYLLVEDLSGQKQAAAAAASASAAAAAAAAAAASPSAIVAPAAAHHQQHHLQLQQQQLLLQAAASTSSADFREFRDLNVVSVSLSLFSVCWALASFSKNVRMHNVHKLVLTWLGVIFQLFWRLGTVSGRALCLVAYALLYDQWILLVVLLHWFSMFLWLVSPNNLFHRERLSRPRKATLCSLIAFVYVFAYINLQEANHRPKMVTFYSVMAVENSLLMYSWYSGAPGSTTALPLAALSASMTGIVFMFLYYRYFHVRRLKYEAGGRLNAPQLQMPLPTDIKEALQNGVQGLGNGGVQLSAPNGLPPAASGASGASPGVLPVGVGGDSGGTTCDSQGSSQPAAAPPSCSPRAAPHTPRGLAPRRLCPPLRHDYQQQTQYKPATRYRYYGGGSHHHGGIPGVFNCRFTNPYCMTKRKKKKPTSFVPPPSVGPSVPFWCRPLANQVVTGDANCIVGSPLMIGGGASPQADAAVAAQQCAVAAAAAQQCAAAAAAAQQCAASSGVVDIQQKLQEKKRQQLAELRVIEEEMLRGKLSPLGDCSPPQYSPQILLAPHYLRACEESSGLPYTLPRQTRYFRRTRLGRHLRPDHYVPPANSSDGDVDSGDDNDSECWHTSIPHLPFRLQQNSRVRHETKL